jgi:polysaccharide export outer membrane protein
MKLQLRTISMLTYAAALCLGQAGPQSPEAPAKPGRAVSDPPKAAAPARSPGTLAKPYVIGPLDVIEVSVWNDVKLSHVYEVSPDGTISMPLVGLIKADGLTATELSAAITEKLLTILNSPEVNIQVMRNNSKKFYIFGGVGHPGEYPLNGETTVLDAFANCAGFKDFANKKKIRILRNTPGAPPRTYYFNYNDVSRGKHMEQNIVLQNGDRIFVDE